MFCDDENVGLRLLMDIIDRFRPHWKAAGRMHISDPGSALPNEIAERDARRTWALLQAWGQENARVRKDARETRRAAYAAMREKSSHEQAVEHGCNVELAFMAQHDKVSVHASWTPNLVCGRFSLTNQFFITHLPYRQAWDTQRSSLLDFFWIDAEWWSQRSFAEREEFSAFCNIQLAITVEKSRRDLLHTELDECRFLSRRTRHVIFSYTFGRLWIVVDRRVVDLFTFES